MANAMDAFVTEAFTLLGLSISIISLRTFARSSSVGFRNFAIDDYLMIFAGCVYTMETCAAYTVVARFRGLANNGMTDEQRRTLTPDDPEWALRIGGSKTQLVGWNLYVLILWSLKLCMAIFYSRLLEGLHLTWRIHIAYGAIAVTYVTTVLSILFGCHPFKKNWQIYPDPGNHCQPAISKINLYVTVVLNVITDAYLMSIPLPLLFRSTMPRRRKILLMGMFSGGIFVMIAGILRCVLIIMDPVNGASQAGSWAVRETFVSTVIGNVPMIYPLVSRTITKVKSSSVFTSKLGGSSAKRSFGGSSHMELGIVDKPSKPTRRKPNLMSLGLTTLGGGDSEEYIVPSNENRPAPIPEGTADDSSVATEFRPSQRNSLQPHGSSGGPAGRHSALGSAYPQTGYSVQISGPEKVPPKEW